MRELNRLLDRLDDGELEKLVLTQRNRLRAVVVSTERYARLEARGVRCGGLGLERRSSAA